MEILFNDVLRINLVVSYLISFPLMRGEGKDGGGRPGLFPPHLNPPPPWGEELFFGSIGVRLSAKIIFEHRPVNRRRNPLPWDRDSFSERKRRVCPLDSETV
jgi:hypothetical protein